MHSGTPGSCTLIFNCGELSEVWGAPGFLIRHAGGPGLSHTRSLTQLPQTLQEGHRQPSVSSSTPPSSPVSRRL